MKAHKTESWMINMHSVTRFWLTSLLLILPACNGAASNAESSAGALNTHETSLEKVCNAISKQLGQPHQLLTGKVIKAGITKPPPGDCFTDECRKAYKTLSSKANFFATLESIESQGKGSLKFRINTPSEDRDVLSKKNSYMEVGKRYRFCAKKADERYPQFGNEPFYYVENVETIIEIK